MSVELEEQLAAYGTWLGRTYRTELSCEEIPAAEGAVDRSVFVESRDRNRGRSNVRARRPRAAAVVILAVGVGGLVVAQRQPDPAPSPAAQFAMPIDPTTHVFVLPQDHEDLSWSKVVCMSQPEPEEDGLRAGPGSVALLGVEDGEGFSDLIAASTRDTVPLGTELSAEVETRSGTALVAEGLPYDQVAQQRNGAWLVLIGSIGSADLLDVLAHVSVSASGGFTVAEGERRSIMSEVSWDPNVVDFSTSYEVIDHATRTGFTVETATSPSAVVLAGWAADRITPTVVNGIAAWIATRDLGPDGVSTAMLWRQTPNRVVAISGDVEVHRLQALAERLQSVGDQEWSAALPTALREE